MKIEKLHQLFLTCKGVATDTRKIKEGELFFALKGDSFNGNKFAEEALKSGAAYAVIDEPQSSKSEKFILVKDSLKTLQKLASFHRNYLKTPILAITGSNGKTTSKELIYAVLSKKFNTLATSGNFNNHIGVPLTLLRLDSSTEMGIIEMGANHPGEIKKLSKITNPDFGYITNFGKAHLEGFGSIEGVIKAKSELYDFLKKNKKLLFLNADDPVQKKQLKYTPNFSFGKSSKADVKIIYRENALLAEVSQGSTIYKSNLIGTYNALNMAVAVCAGNYFKVPEKEIKSAIESYSPQNNRSQILQLPNMNLLMDAYNANPTSMAAALGNFSNYPHEKKIVILGDMFEVGETSNQEHQNIVSSLGDLSFKKAFLVGEQFEKTITKDSRINRLHNFEELKEVLKKVDTKDSFILIKGSRGMALERLVEFFKNQGE